MKTPLPNQTKLVHHCRIHDALLLCFGIHHIFLRIPGYFRDWIPWLFPCRDYAAVYVGIHHIFPQNPCLFPCRDYAGVDILPKNPWLFPCRDYAGVDVGIHHIFLRIPGYFCAGIMLV